MTAKSNLNGRKIEYNGKEWIYSNTKRIVKTKPIEPDHNITITSPDGKHLRLDFNTGKLKTSGNLEQDKAAKMFLEHLDFFFRNAIKKGIKEDRENFIKLLKGLSGFGVDEECYKKFIELIDKLNKKLK